MRIGRDHHKAVDALLNSTIHHLTAARETAVLAVEKAEEAIGVHTAAIEHHHVKLTGATELKTEATGLLTDVKSAIGEGSG